MKSILVFLVFMSLLSCNKGEVFWVSPAASIFVEDDEVDKSSQARVNGKIINSKYTELDAFSCLFDYTLGGGILKSLFTAITIGLDSVVDTRIEKDLILKVKSELKSYIKTHGKIAPDDFWKAISEASQDELIISILKFNTGISTEDLFTHKQALGYAFLYFLEVEDESGVYQFTFDDRRTNQHGVKFDYYISFADSKLKKHAKQINSCNYFRFTDIDVNKYDNNLDKVRMCWNDKQYAKISMDITEELRLSFKDKKTYYSEMFYANDLTVERLQDRTVFRMNYDDPKYEISLINQNNKEFASIKRENFYGEKLELNDMRCRTIIEL